MPVPNRARNKDGRFRKKRRDAKGYQVKESESQRTLQGDDMGREGPHSLSEEVVLKIREGVEAHRNLKRDGEKDD